MNDATSDGFRELLKRENIKLWLSPYNDENGDASLKELAARLGPKLKLSESEAMPYLKALQEKALQNLQEREEFKATGMASIRILPSERGRTPIIVKITVYENGSALKEKAAEALQTSSKRMKLICKGKLLKDEESLFQQEVSNGAQVMCLMLTGSPEETAAFEKQKKSLDITKRDVEMIAKGEERAAGSYLEIADQTGKALKIPTKERKALVMAMTFHEKGKAAVKKGDFETALALLLEAEKEFNLCNSGLLEQVDNYGLLSLDIAWCYLNLRNISQLPDAEVRLQRCEEVFAKSYGPNLERLVNLKGTAGNERALFLRLHLLRAIVFFHRGKLTEALVLLNQVAGELKILKVDDSQLSQLQDMGYSPGESRLALRESRGDLDLAVTVIETKRAERKKLLEEEMKEKKLEKERQQLGKCKNGGWIEPSFHKSLLSMGYSYYAAKWALGQTDNRISDAIALIQEHPEQMPFDELVIQRLMSMGYTMKAAITALELHGGDFTKAYLALAAKVNPNMPSSSHKQDEIDAFNRLSEGLEDYEDNHLDIALDLEERFYTQYRQLIEGDKTEVGK